jgi:hypothetical protein
MYRLLVLALIVLAPSAWADLLNISASERGWVCTGSNLYCPTADNNGTAANNNYFAGAQISGFPGNPEAQFRDWFEFSIPTLTGALVSATLNLDEPADGNMNGPFTYAVYGLSGQPLVFTDVTNSDAFGSVGTSSASNGTTVTITLNASALAAIGADQGGNIFIGGIDSGELSSSTSASTFGDFAGSSPGGTAYNTVLSLQTTPEPSSLLLLATVLGTLGMAIRKQRVG